MESGDGLKKIILMGIGAVAGTVEKSSKIVNELVKKGELTVHQGKVLNEELKHNIKNHMDSQVGSSAGLNGESNAATYKSETDNKEEKQDIKTDKTITLNELKEILKDLNFATKDDITSLHQRLNALEKKYEDSQR